MRRTFETAMTPTWHTATGVIGGSLFTEVDSRSSSVPAGVAADAPSNLVLPNPASRPSLAPHLSLPSQRTSPEQGRRRPRRIPAATGVPSVLLFVDVLSFAAATVLTGTVNFKTLAMLALIFGLFVNANLYHPRLSLSLLDDAPTIVGRAVVAGAGTMALGGLDDGSAGTARLETAVVFAALCLAGRGIAYAGVRAARRAGWARSHTLIVGGGTLARTLSQNMLDHPEYGLFPVGLVDDDPLLAPNERPVPLLGGHRDLGRIIREHSIRVAVVTFSSAPETQVIDTLRACDRLSCDILLVPRLYEMHTVSRDCEIIWGIPLVRPRRAAFRTLSWTVKRMLDVVVATATLLVLSPVLIVCALLTRWETGSVLFRQTRVGLDGRPFTILKFCSLKPLTDTDSTERWTISRDDRLRPVGKILRATSLDELPQLWNILRGDMSLVGPRPERPYFVEEFTKKFPWYLARHRVPTGLTGWAQVHGLRGNTSIADRARFDNFYIENWSLWGDVKILLRTAGQVVRAMGR